MSENQTPYQPREGDNEPLHDIDPDVLDLAKRYREAMVGTESNIELLVELHADPDKRDDFDQLLVELASEAAMLDERFKDNMAKLRAGRLRRAAVDEPRIRKEQKEILEEYKLAILSAAGLSGEDAKPQMEQCRLAIREKVKAILKETPECGNLKVLEGLGIVKEQGDGIKYVYPEGLFPKTVDRKWGAYIGIVDEHEKVVRELKVKERIGMESPVSQDDVTKRDQARRLAHDSLAKDMHHLLGLDTLNLESDTPWDFEKTRKLIDKMRTQIMPDIDSDEKDTTARAITIGSIGLQHALEILSIRAQYYHPAGKKRSPQKKSE